MIDPYKATQADMLAEIEAFLSFRLTGENPRLEEKELWEIKNDIKTCLKSNGFDPDDPNTGPYLSGSKTYKE